jgi:peptidyl-dipeptidase Dcp
MAEFNTPFQTVPFDAIKTEDYKPAISRAIKEAKYTIHNIVKNSEEPTFENTVEALERSTIRINHLANILYNLNQANTNEEIQNTTKDISAILTEFSNDINLNEELFGKVKTVFGNKDDYKLTA